MIKYGSIQLEFYFFYYFWNINYLLLALSCLVFQAEKTLQLLIQKSELCEVSVPVDVDLIHFPKKNLKQSTKIVHKVWIAYKNILTVVIIIFFDSMSKVLVIYFFIWLCMSFHIIFFYKKNIMIFFLEFLFKESQLTFLMYHQNLMIIKYKNFSFENFKKMKFYV